MSFKIAFRVFEESHGPALIENRLFASNIGGIIYPCAGINSVARLLHLGWDGRTITFPKVYRNISSAPLDCIPSQISDLEQHLREKNEFTSHRRFY